MKSADPLSISNMRHPSKVVRRNDGHVKLLLISRIYFKRRVTLRKSLPPAIEFFCTTQFVYASGALTSNLLDVLLQTSS